MIEVGRIWRLGAMGVLLLASAVCHGAEVRVFAAESFLRFLQGPDGHAIFERYGFQ